jgi:small subunit ribosomal protein S8
MAGSKKVIVPSSSIKLAIVEILKDEGFIEGFQVLETEGKAHKSVEIRLKYVGERRDRRPVISGLKRISRPGRRVYVGKKEIPWVQAGLGVAIMTTPKGVMTGGRARQLGVGGEILCEVW